MAVHDSDRVTCTTSDAHTSNCVDKIGSAIEAQSDYPVESLPEPTVYNTPTGQTISLSASQLDGFRQLRREFPSQRDHVLLRWLAAKKYDAKEAASNLHEHLKWSSVMLPVDVSTIASLVLGDEPVLVRLSQAADDGSAVVKIAARLLPPPTKESIELCTQAVIWAVESGLRVTDRLSVIYDRSGDTSTSVELDYAKPIVSVLDSHYPETLSKAFLFPVGGAFRFGAS